MHEIIAPLVPKSHPKVKTQCTRSGCHLSLKYAGTQHTVRRKHNLGGNQHSKKSDTALQIFMKPLLMNNCSWKAVNVILEPSLSFFACASQAKPCAACLSWRMVTQLRTAAATLLWRGVTLTSPLHLLPYYTPCCTWRQVEEAPWTAIWMQIPGYMLLAAHCAIEETG